MAYLEQTGMLAKLLATENLVVEHSHTAETAAFDTQNRVLTLPVFSTSSRYVSNLLVAHEVSHALNTPTDWAKRIPAGVSFDFVNVIEDVRIERLIQSRYPGLRTDFSRGYDELNDKDFFGIAGKDLSKMKLIDRINLHFKLGARAVIPFSETEMMYVRAVDEADTYDKVLLVAKMISDAVNNPADDETESVSSDNNAEGDDQQQSDRQNSNSSSEQQSNETDEQDDGDSSVDSDVKNDTTMPTANDDNTADTQQNFDEKMKEMLEKGSAYTDNVYLSIPELNVDEFVVNTDKLRNSYYGSPSDHMLTRYHEFMDSIKRDVNFMVQQFEMRKSADAYARQQVHKTGVLNTSQLHNYKLTDDLFLRQNITPDGKSHGMVMYLDWSGSMANIAFNTVKQVLVLAQFCRKTGIAFEVYAMTTGYSNHEADEHNQINFFDTYLCRVLSSTAKRRDLDKDMLHLFCEGYSVDHYDDYHSHMMSMGGTPLNNALIATPQILNDFRSRTGAQKVSFVCLTDGESGPVSFVERGLYDPEQLVKSYTWQQRILMRDGHRVVDLGNHNGMTAKLMEWITSLTDVTATNIFVGSERECWSFVRHSTTNHEFDTSELRKTHSTSIQQSNKWLVCLMKPQAFATTDDNFDVADNASKAQIRNALKKHLKNKQTSRKLLTNLASQFS